MTTIETTKREGPLPVLRVSDADTHAQVMSGARNRAMSPALFATQLLNLGLRAIAGPKSAPDATPVDHEQPYASFPKGARMLLELRDEEIEELKAEVERFRASGLATPEPVRRPATVPPPADDAAPDRASLLSRALARLTVSICDEPVGVLAMLDAECDAWNERNTKAPPRDRVTQALALLATAGGRLAALRKDAAKRASK